MKTKIILSFSIIILMSAILFFFVSCCCPPPPPPPPWSFDWPGNKIIPDSDFFDPLKWTKNQADYGQGDRCDVISDGTSLQINWTFGSGNRDKWAQCYMVFPSPISLDNTDIFAFDIKGSAITGDVGFELKFEDGSNAAILRWERLARLERWGDKIIALKKQFDNPGPIDWQNISVLSFAVYASASGSYTTPESGIINIKNLVSSLTTAWEKADDTESISSSQNSQIKTNAINALVTRQKSTGLLTTWTEDNSAWLYGQGLALKALCNEGTWTGVTPTNSYAQAAEKLALFLANNQVSDCSKYYWPRTWDSITGDIINRTESDNTIWMGDFPWPIIGLQCYYKKTTDARVITAIQRGLQTLKSLIDINGQVYTFNISTCSQPELTSCEAYAAVLQSLYESNESALADTVLNNITGSSWDTELHIWKEGKYSSRPVLFANTWLAPFQIKKGNTDLALDALSLIGRVMYTRGPGEPYGMDGICPLAVWYEGTLSYISARGPGSRMLFDNIKSYINSDGTVCHYNDTIDNIAGIWAVPWHSLDGTSWLYFAASGTSPFNIYSGTPVSAP